MRHGVNNLEDAELAGLVGRAFNARHDPDQLRTHVQAIIDWHDNRWVRWLDVLEARRRERWLAFLSELDELEREIEARLEESVAA